MTYQNPAVVLVNESTVLTDAEVTAIASALRYQVHHDFGPIWHTGCRLSVIPKTETIPSAAWVLGLFDDSDQAGALGYHDVTKAGLPLGKVFAKTDLDDGYSVSVTASHELLEMLADPTIDRCSQIGASTFYAIEVGDAVEDDSFGYELPMSNGQPVLVSDFVTPSWFDALPGPYDFKGHTTQPRQILAGGYIGAWSPSTGWTQKTHDGTPGPTPPVGSRRERRARGKDRWRHSER